jgi:D-arginine dehydrogenase
VSPDLPTARCGPGRGTLVTSAEVLMADVLVVGGGIAGISVAAALSTDADVVLAEREPQLARHTTGRSAAMFLESYGSHEIRCLTRASRAHLAGSDSDTATDAAGGDAGGGTTASGVLTPRPLLWIARADQVADLDRALKAVPGLKPLDLDRALDLCPVLDPEYVAAAALEPSACDIDVAQLVQDFTRTARSNGAAVMTGAEVVAASRRDGTWSVTTTAGVISAPVVVLAAGAWADETAALFGTRPLDLRPLRRTIAVARPGTVAIEPHWPLAASVDEAFYFRPEGPNLLLSPADETPSAPCDARPEEADVARALERVNAATLLGLRSVHTAWAGLRTFAPDRNPVVGYDPDADGVFWLAGQGGYGIQTAPALARLAAALVRHEPLPADLAAAGVDPARLGPSRVDRDGGAGARAR